MDGDVYIGAFDLQRAYGALFAGTRFERIEAIELHGVEVRDLVDLIVGHTNEGMRQQVCGVWPCTVGVGIIALPGHTVNANLVTQIDTSLIVDKAGREVLVEQLSWGLATKISTGPSAVVAVGVIHALKGVRDPTNTTFRKSNRKFGERFEKSASTSNRLRAKNEFIGVMAMLTSAGASMEVTVIDDEEPICIHTTVSVS